MKLHITLEIDDPYKLLPQAQKDLVDELAKNLSETTALSIEEARQVFAAEVFKVMLQKEVKK